MTELQLIASLKAKAPRIGDDCAVIPFGTRDLLFTTDLMVEGVHFLPSFAPAAIGAKAVVRSISDIAAMGGSPRWCLVSLAMPAGWPVRQFYQGVFRELKRYGVELIGGDMSRTDRFTCDVTVCGEVPRGKALLRSGARPGDVIFVTGSLGAAAARGFAVPPVPRARIDMGRRLRGVATSCMDLSDGLSLDLHRLCMESKVSAHLDAIPIARGASLENALHGGEDYELLFTAPRRNSALKDAIPIGVVHQGSPGRVYLNGSPVAPRGHDHFRAAIE